MRDFLRVGMGVKNIHSRPEALQFAVVKLQEKIMKMRTIENGAGASLQQQRGSRNILDAKPTEGELIKPETGPRIEIG